MKTRNLTNDVVSITSNVKASSWLFFVRKEKQTSSPANAEKHINMETCATTITTNPQALLDKFIKDKKSPTVHCANLLKTNFLEA